MNNFAKIMRNKGLKNITRIYFSNLIDVKERLKNWGIDSLLIEINETLV